MTTALIVFVLAFVPMAFEARLSARNERALRAAGALEPHDDVYRWMQIAYPAAFLGMVIEAAFRQPRMHALFAGGVVVYIVGKVIKYWAIATLRSRWSFRVLVPPASSLTSNGPYQFMRHPNYLGVMGELVGVAMMARALVSGTVSVVVFAVLLLLRIRVEERAHHQARSR